MSAPLIVCLQAERLRTAIHTRPGGEVGCCWHTVLDDGNIDNEDVRQCARFADAAGHTDCRTFGPLLAQMSRTQRAKLRVGGYSSDLRAMSNELETEEEMDECLAKSAARSREHDHAKR